MKLSFKYNVKNINSTEQNIISDLVWHTKKVSNMLLYDIREGKEKLELNKNLNIISSEIYRKYRETNWHSEYLHSHMLQEAILGVIASYKSYVSLSRIYKEDNSKLKGKPNFPRFKNNNSIQEIIFTKYAIRVEKNILKLSISKKIQEKYKVKSLNFLIPRKLRKLVDFGVKIDFGHKSVEMI